jgi:CRP-like cAMP-binding protein
MAHKNLLLAALSRQEQTRLAPKLHRVQLALKDSLYEADEPIEHVYFPVNGVISLVTTANGKTAEVGTIGNEGMVGLPLFLRSDRIHMRAFAQIPGESLRMAARDFRAEIRDPNSALSLQLYRYTQAFLVQIAQSAACNALDNIDQRCARWLLLTHDRIGEDHFPLTHEFLSQMLGVRRAGVTKAAGKLQKAGLVRYKQGEITILDRKGLEKASCQHYHVVRAEYERIFSRR